jgi:AcrR family transcriptional regulator
MPEMTASTREVARRLGVSDTAIHKAERSGRIAREPDGQWDIDKTRRRLTETADPIRSPLANGANAEGTPFARLKVAQLALKVEAQRLSLDETKRRLLDVNEANAALDEIGSTMRDALLNWPARVSGLIAAETGVDPHLLQTILQSHINHLLTEAADRFDPAGLGGDRSPQP